MSTKLLDQSKKQNYSGLDLNTYSSHYGITMNFDNEVDISIALNITLQK